MDKDKNLRIKDNISTIGVIVNKGFEKVAVSQIREIIGTTTEINVHDTVVCFEAKTESKKFDKVFEFIYRNQITNRVLYVLSEFEYPQDDDSILEAVRKIIFNSEDKLLNDIIINSADFRSSVKLDEHTDVTYLESEIGGIILDYAKSLGTELKVNLNNPTLNIYLYVYNGSAYLGIDLSGDLSKREYKIFNNAVSLKGPTAFGLLMLAGYKPKNVYLNPCCHAGIIEIEAALYSTKTSHKYYNKTFPFMKIFQDIDWEKFYKEIDSNRITDKFPITGSDKLLSSITAAVKNAKIAGIESALEFRRIDMDWMDVKFEEKDVDKIITFIPGSSKHDKNISKEYKELFYQAEYILKNSGTLTIMCLTKDLLIDASKEYFDLEQESVVHSGSQTMYVLSFKKKNTGK
jgi:23S rRNA G2445 N2-methylase RlmL